MIMPNKNINIEYSLLNCGAVILKNLKEKDTISSIWDKTRKNKAIVSFEKFILTLDYLYIIGLVKISDGMLVRVNND